MHSCPQSSPHSVLLLNHSCSRQVKHRSCCITITDVVHDITQAKIFLSMHLYPGMQYSWPCIHSCHRLNFQLHLQPASCNHMNHGHQPVQGKMMVLSQYMIVFSRPATWGWKWCRQLLLCPPHIMLICHSSYGQQARKGSYQYKHASDHSPDQLIRLRSSNTTKSVK